MRETEPIATPMATSTNLIGHEREDFEDPNLYGSTVGVLQYLSLTMPDIAFIVNNLSQFMHNSKLIHRQSVKHLMRYLKQTIDHGLIL